MASSGFVEHLITPISLLILFLALVFLFAKQTPSKPYYRLPPGPKPWPVVGNIKELYVKPHQSFAASAQTYGPLMCLRLGTQIVVVGSTPEAASKILKTHDRELSGRYVPHASFARDPEFNRESVAWHFECSEVWKSFRTLLQSEVFGSNFMEAQATIRQNVAREMREYLKTKQNSMVKIRDVVYAYTFNALSNIYMSKNFLIFEGEESKRMSRLVRDMMEIWTALNISDLFPSLGGLDLQGIRKKADLGVKLIYEFWDEDIKERRKNRLKDGGEKPKDFLDTLLDSGFSDEQISHIFLEILGAASDGSTSTVEWALAELLKNPATLSKLQREVSELIPDEDLVTEAHLANLPYLHACFKETLRLHPPAPLLLPHRAIKDVQVMGYTIPKDAQVYVNIWAIARDSKVWKDPLIFKPERFLDGESDYKGNHFNYLPFGSGRKICAGIVMASRMVRLALANLVHGFKLSLPDGMNPNQLDMEEKYGVTLMKEKPLVIVFK